MGCQDREALSPIERTRFSHLRDLRASLLGCTQAVDLAEDQASYLLEKINERVDIFTAAGFYSARTRDLAVSSSEDSATRAVFTQLFLKVRFQENLLSHRLFRLRYLELLEDAMAALDRLIVLLEAEGAT